MKRRFYVSDKPTTSEPNDNADMTELKTLKDLQTKGSEEDFVNCGVVSDKQLKREAIKWIKELEGYHTNSGFSMLEMWQKETANCTSWSA